MTLKQWKVATAAVLTILAAAGSANGQPLSDSEIGSTLVGNIFVVGNNFTLYRPDGSYGFYNGGELRTRGEYKISDGRICYAPGGLPSDSCDRYVREGDSLVYETKGGRNDGSRGRGFVAPADILSNDGGPASTITACDQSVSATIQPTPANLPQNAAIFSGAWIGRLSTALCVGFIAEKIAADGTVRLRYLTGSHTSLTAKNGLRIGRIVNGMLSFRIPPNVNVEVKAGSDTRRLSGTYYWGNFGHFPTDLTRPEAPR